MAAVFCAVLVSCNTIEAIYAPEQDNTVEIQGIKFNINISDIADTKALKTAWANGDKVNIWFNENNQQTPDLVLTYNGSAWNAGTLRAGIDASTFESAENKIFSVTYEGFNDLSSYNFEEGTHTYERNADVRGVSIPQYNMTVFAQGVAYTFSENTVSATIQSTDWFYGTGVQVVITGIDGNDAALYTLSCPQLYSTSPISAGYSSMFVDPMTYAGVFNADGVAFYFVKPRSKASVDYEFTLVDYTDASPVVKTYTATGKTLDPGDGCAGIKIAASKFTPTVHTATTDVLPGVFTVYNERGKVKKVKFATGNLWTNANAFPQTWDFESNQYSYTGSSPWNAWDLNHMSYFFWEGKVDKYGDGPDYAGGTDGVSTDVVDWGIPYCKYKSLTPGTWRTLTYLEWKYVKEHSVSGAATVNGVQGIILLPDEFTDPNVMGNTDSSTGAFAPGFTSGYATNTYTLINWNTMQTAGAVFLPAAGRRYYDSSQNKKQGDASSTGYYWSSKGATSTSTAWVLEFNSSSFNTVGYGRNSGLSVRLVTDVN